MKGVFLYYLEGQEGWVTPVLDSRKLWLQGELSSVLESRSLNTSGREEVGMPGLSTGRQDFWASGSIRQ